MKKEEYMYYTAPLIDHLVDNLSKNALGLAGRSKYVRHQGEKERARRMGLRWKTERHPPPLSRQATDIETMSESKICE